jgi:hypothetical protein
MNWQVGYLVAGALNGVPKQDAAPIARTDVAVRPILLLLSAAARKERALAMARAHSGVVRREVISSDDHHKFFTSKPLRIRPHTACTPAFYAQRQRGNDRDVRLHEFSEHAFPVVVHVVPCG